MISLCLYCNCMTTDVRVNNTRERTIICGKCKKRKYVKKKMIKLCANCKWEKLKFHTYKKQDYMRTLCFFCLNYDKELCNHEAR